MSETRRPEARHRSAPSGGPQQSRHYPAIDGLRAFAVLAVIVYHVRPGSLGRGGFLGVDVFFAISGFVITLTLLRESERTGRVSLWNFYRRRFWRLTPALVTMIAVAAVLELGVGAVTGGRFIGEAGSALGYVYDFMQAGRVWSGEQGLTHCWSLAVEEQFYLVWAPLFALVVVAIAGQRRRFGVVVAAIAALVLGRIVTAATLGTFPAFYLPWCRMDELLIGGALAIALHGRVSDLVRRLAGSPVVAGAAALALLAACGAVGDLFGKPLSYGGYTCVALASAALVGHGYVEAGGRSPVRALLSWRPVVWLGERSYGVYLYHYPIAVALRHENAGLAERAVLVAGGAVVLAAVSYRWVETPLRRRGHQQVS